MKNLIYSFLILYLFLLAACKKEDPEIAPIIELPALSFSESFICQPIAFNDQLISLVNRNNITSLCSYGGQGNKLWQKSVDQYIIPGATFIDIKQLSIDKVTNGEIILSMYRPIFDQAQQLKNQFISFVNFTSSGNFQWQMTDSIHQPDTIIIKLDIIDVKSTFKKVGALHLSTGLRILLSSQIADKVDSTYLQLSTYDNKGIFINDRYLKIKGRREIDEVFLTLNDEMLIFNRILPNRQFYTLLDLNGNIKFEKAPPEPIVENYFFHENSNGIFIVSASFVDKTGNFRGIVFSIDKNGDLSWSGNSSIAPNWIMMSVQEKSDCYIYSGFSAGTAVLPAIDWRSTFLQNEYQAVIQKTDLNWKEIWHQILPGIANTVGAASIGTDQIDFFSGKFDNKVENIVLLKLDAEGIIINK